MTWVQLLQLPRSPLGSLMVRRCSRKTMPRGCHHRSQLPLLRPSLWWCVPTLRRNLRAIAPPLRSPFHMRVRLSHVSTYPALAFWGFVYKGDCGAVVSQFVFASSVIACE